MGGGWGNGGFWQVANGLSALAETPWRMCGMPWMHLRMAPAALAGSPSPLWGSGHRTCGEVFSVSGESSPRLRGAFLQVGGAVAALAGSSCHSCEKLSPHLR